MKKTKVGLIGLMCALVIIVVPLMVGCGPRYVDHDDYFNLFEDFENFRVDYIVQYSGGAAHNVTEIKVGNAVYYANNKETSERIVYKPNKKKVSFYSTLQYRSEFYRRNKNTSIDSFSEPNEIFLGREVKKHIGPEYIGELDRIETIIDVEYNIVLRQEKHYWDNNKGCYLFRSLFEVTRFEIGGQSLPVL